MLGCFKLSCDISFALTFLLHPKESEKQIVKEIHEYDDRVTNRPAKPSIVQEPPIMTSQFYPDGGPLNKAQQQSQKLTEKNIESYVHIQGERKENQP